jgi:hypothetical protein
VIGNRAIIRGRAKHSEAIFFRKSGLRRETKQTYGRVSGHTSEWKYPLFSDLEGILWFCMTAHSKSAGGIVNSLFFDLENEGDFGNDSR